jgi:hypothetical protein
MADKNLTRIQIPSPGTTNFKARMESRIKDEWRDPGIDPTKVQIDNSSAKHCTH